MLTTTFCTFGTHSHTRNVSMYSSYSSVNSLGTALFCCKFNLVDTDQLSLAAQIKHNYLWLSAVSEEEGMLCKGGSPSIIHALL